MSGRPRARRVRATVALAMLAVAPAAVGAQAPAPRAALSPEVRLDGAFGREGGAFVGAGLFGDAGLYTRLGVVGGVGLVRDVTGRGAGDADRTLVPAARVEALARFHLDPQRFSRRGVYVGGGVAAAVRDGAAPQWQLVALLGVEGRPRGRVAPALEVGLGGGARVAVALRRARAGRR